MLNRSLRLAHTALALFAALLGFLFLHSFESYMPVGPAWYVDVVRPAQDKAPFSEINARIEAYARTRRLDVAKLVPDRKDPKGVEHLYVLAASGGSFAQSWMERGYGAFNAEISYKVHPRSEASALEPAGTYLLSGSREDLRGFRETLAGYGYNVDSYTETMTLRSLPWLFGGYALFGTAAVITLLIVALTGVGVAMNARAYGVQRLQGMTLRQAWALDARASLTFLSKAVGVLAVPLLAALYLYNSLHQLTAFLLLFAALGALGVLLTLCVHGVSLWILWHSSILDAIKGSGASRWTTASAYMVRGTAILVAAILGGIVVNDALTRTKAQDIGGQWETARDLGEIRLNVGLDSDDSSGSAGSAGPTRRADSPDERIAAWERSLNRRGLLMVSIVNPGQEQFSVPAGAPIDSLYANQSYLDRQRVKDVAGRPVTAPTGSDEAVVAIPQRYRPHTAQILKQAVEMLRFTGGASQSRGGNGPERKSRLHPRRTATVHLQGARRLRQSRLPRRPHHRGAVQRHGSHNDQRLRRLHDPAPHPRDGPPQGERRGARRPAAVPGRLRDQLGRLRTVPEPSGGFPELRHLHRQLRDRARGPSHHDGGVRRRAHAPQRPAHLRLADQRMDLLEHVRQTPDPGLLAHGGGREPERVAAGRHVQRPDRLGERPSRAPVRARTDDPADLGQRPGRRTGHHGGRADPLQPPHRHRPQHRRRIGDT